MMPNKTYELRNLYFQQSQYCSQQVKPDYQLLLQWPEDGYFEKLKPDADLLQKALSPVEKLTTYSIADQVFGNQKQSEYLGIRKWQSFTIRKTWFIGVLQLYRTALTH